MKITKSKLMKIIKEELSKVFQEQFGLKGYEDPLRGASFPGLGRYPGEMGEPTQTMADEESLMPGQAANPYEKLNTDLERWNRKLPANRALAKRQINDLRRTGQIDTETWRLARRALYRSQSEADMILDAAFKEKGKWSPGLMQMPEDL